MSGKLAAMVLTLVTVIGSAIGVCAGGEERRDKRQERIETLTMWKMMEALDLDKATADKIFQIRQRYLSERKELRKAVRRDFQRLRYLLRESSERPRDEELERLLTSIRNNRKDLRELWEKQYNEVAKVLTVRQQAELVLFLKEFRNELRLMLGRGHRREGLPPPPQGPGMPPPVGSRFRGGPNAPQAPPPPPPHPQTSDRPWNESGGPDEGLEEP